MRWFLGFFFVFFLQLNAVIPEKVILCVSCRDISKYFPAIINDLENIGSLFQDYRIVAYENNSEDDTPSLLYRWKRTNPKVSVVIEFLSDQDFAKSIVNRKEGQFSRAEQRSQARNKALMIALSQFDEKFSSIICVDANVKLFSIEEIPIIFKEKKNWDAVFAYRIDESGNFNDWGAFRDPFFLFGPELIGNAWYTDTKQFSLKKDDPWYSVYSAFGGFAIYKRKAIQHCKYEALVTFDLELAARKWFFETLSKSASLVACYLQTLEQMTNLIYIHSPSPNLPQLNNANCGIYITKESFFLVWKMHGVSDRYPAVCEHLPFHASMYCRGHCKLFINPRLVSVERDSHYVSHPSQDELINYSL